MLYKNIFLKHTSETLLAKRDLTVFKANSHVSQRVPLPTNDFGVSCCLVKILIDWVWFDGQKIVEWQILSGLIPFETLAIKPGPFFWIKSWHPL